MAYVDLFPAGLADTPILRYISHIDRIHVTPAYIAIATDVTHTHKHTHLHCDSLMRVDDTSFILRSLSNIKYLHR